MNADCYHRLSSVIVRYAAGSVFAARLWPPYEIGQAIIFFAMWFLSIFYLSFFISLPNLSGRRSDVYHTSTHGVALVQI